MKVTVVNEGSEPVMLDDGTQIGAAYTSESRRVVTLSERDRALYVRPGRLAVVEDGAGTSAQAHTPEAGKGGRGDK
jgi:hypothetical protein